MVPEAEKIAARLAPSQVVPVRRQFQRDDDLSRASFGARGRDRTKNSAPPAPPKRPPTAIAPSGDGWFEITTQAKGEAPFTWRVQIRPFPESSNIPVKEGSGFVRLAFEGITRETILKILEIYNLSVDEVALRKIQENAIDSSLRSGADKFHTDKFHSEQCLLIPERGVPLSEREFGRGRFSAAAAVENIFLRLSGRPGF